MPDEGAKDWDYQWDRDLIVPYVPFPLPHTYSPEYVVYEGVFKKYLKDLLRQEHQHRAEDMAELVSDVFQDANEEHWGFDLRGLFQWPQIIRYKPGEEHPPYGWHTDYNDEDRSKLGMSVCLGNAGPVWMELHLYGPVSLIPGDVLVFPGYIAHQVPRVVKGERVALAAWAGGPPWR